ncbi:MAG: transglutaminaseTgpA domain-containing protein, partial [Acidobacteriota bacterium]
ARAKRRLLGGLAQVAPLPLPFNQAFEWPLLFVYLLLLVAFLRKVEQGSDRWLSNRTLNLLGLAYFPLLILDVWRGLARSEMIDPLLHLLLFLVVVKLFSLRRERDVWHVLIALFFTFAAAMATSSHLTILLYLVVFVAMAIRALGQLSHLRLLAATRPDGEDDAPPALPGTGAWLTAATLIVLMIGAPLFAAMPRLRDPFLFGQGGGSGSTTGFSDSVDLNLTSAIRGNRQVAMRVQYESGQRGDLGDDIRFKAATYDRYDSRSWHREGDSEHMIAAGRHRPLVPGAAERAVERAILFLEPIGARSLPLPVETVAVRLPASTTLWRDAGGAVSLPMAPAETVRYEAVLGDRPVFIERPRADPSEPPPGARDLGGLTPRMTELANAVMRDGASPTRASLVDGSFLRGQAAPAAVDEPADGDGDAAIDGGTPANVAGAVPRDRDDDSTRIDRLERYLISTFDYTLDFVGRGGSEPLDAFLFEHQSGHCELFASAMVLMLRSQDIPARLVTGFLGAEWNPLEGYYIVRQDNAHAWVEAWTPDRGWQIYDPTPPDGRPGAAPASALRFFSQLWDYLIFRYDRYVLSYGTDDQASIFQRLKTQIEEWWQRLTGDDEAALPAPDGAAPAASAESSDDWAQRGRQLIAGGGSALALLLALGVGFWFWRRRQPPRSARDAYGHLRHLLGDAGFADDDALVPSQVRRRASARFPGASASIATVIDLYLRERFAERPLDARGRQRLADALTEARAQLRQAGRTSSHPTAPAASN